MIICKIKECEYAKKRKDDLFQCSASTIGITEDGKCDTELIFTDEMKKEMQKHNNELLEKIHKICDGIEYSRSVPNEAEKIAKENGIVIIVGGSDDLMYCYGADSYLTDYCEHSYGWDGDTLTDIDDKKLEGEAKQLGLKIWWCGAIEGSGLKRENYNTDESGAFSYTVNDDIQALDFKVMEDETDVYCTGKIIKLPLDFVSKKDSV